MLLSLILLAYDARNVANDISSCLEKGNIIIMKNISSNVSFDEQQLLHKDTAKCLKSKGFYPSFGCTQNSKICVSNQINLSDTFNIIQTKPHFHISFPISH